jgi:hypothetical protein
MDRTRTHTIEPPHRTSHAHAHTHETTPEPLDSNRTRTGTRTSNLEPRTSNPWCITTLPTLHRLANQLIAGDLSEILIINKFYYGVCLIACSRNSINQSTKSTNQSSQSINQVNQSKKSINQLSRIHRGMLSIYLFDLSETNQN